MSGDAAKIAAGLTKAQRAAVVSASAIPDGTEAWGIRSTRRALIRKGLCEDDGSHCVESWWFNELTPLGLAVRAHLENSDA